MHILHLTLRNTKHAFLQQEICLFNKRSQRSQILNVVLTHAAVHKIYQNKTVKIWPETQCHFRYLTVFVLVMWRHFKQYQSCMNFDTQPYLVVEKKIQEILQNVAKTTDLRANVMSKWWIKVKKVKLPDKNIPKSLTAIVF